jgi:L-ornithine Nalpha-acyltransferase
MNESGFKPASQRGGLQLRLARDARDVLASQRLRYHVFYEEMNARPAAAASGLDADRFDAICDHLLVIDTRGTVKATPFTVDGGELVGTYRLLRQEIAVQHFGFYTQGEFDIASLIARKPDLRFLELGRSCVLKQHRSKPVVELLWQGIWDYVRVHKMDVMVGCASLEGTDPDAHAEALSFLSTVTASPDWTVRAHDDKSVEMRRRQPGAFNQRRALAALPPLIKGYLRLGCRIGEGAVIDTQFNSIDVLIILPVSQINPRYFQHFGAPVAG